ncbi:MAG: type II toxin-antitoxin system HipA family toxin [Treponema sp.]|jgi:serine/threonine-protein kinase HipA|nr:type II toxin-antitoxin system HipA family toxin [Treponema sp.]
MDSKKIYVSIALGKNTVPAGTLWSYYRNGRETASFEYFPEWLTLPERFALEPGLQLTEGAFHTPQGMSLFGAIGDSAPDRWGRILMRRNEERRVKKTGEAARTLTELDYLLGINDEARQGALRFSENPDGPFLSLPKRNAIPPLLALPKLLSATERFLDSKESDEDLKLLLAPGSSLGGARPKASVYEKNGSLAIAKFPRKNDEFNLVIWEAAALTLAHNAGIRVPAWHLEQVLGKPVLIIKRFDRSGPNRIPFLSAMSMLGAQDNESHSYLEIAYALSQYGAEPDKDLAELWRRIVFNILISNTDDHLRNHGFLYESPNGWRLSPAYDMNPTPLEMGPHILSTAIDFSGNEASLETALSVIADFRISKKDADTIIQTVSGVVKSWKTVARALGVHRSEIERMATAFCV